MGDRLDEILNCVGANEKALRLYPGSSKLPVLHTFCADPP